MIQPQDVNENQTLQLATNKIKGTALLMLHCMFNSHKMSVLIVLNLESVLCSICIFVDWWLVYGI
jgi:hypothetical protein